MIFFADSDPTYILRMVYVCWGSTIAILGNWMERSAAIRSWAFAHPETLKSDYVWERTHRVGGRLMALLGIVVALAAILLPIWAGIVIFIAGLLTLCAWAMFYSRLLRREEAQAPSSQQPCHSGRSHANLRLALCNEKAARSGNSIGPGDEHAEGVRQASPGQSPWVPGANDGIKP